MLYVCDLLYAVLYIHVNCFVVCGCTVSRRYINVCNCDVFSVVNMYLDHLKIRVVCYMPSEIYGRNGVTQIFSLFYRTVSSTTGAEDVTLNTWINLNIARLYEKQCSSSCGSA